MPPDYSVSPSTVQVGDTVLVQAQDSDCDPRYGKNAKIQVTVTDGRHYSPSDDCTHE